MNISTFPKPDIAIRISDIKRRMEAVRLPFVYEITSRLLPETAPVCNLKKGTPEHDFHSNAMSDIEYLLKAIHTKE